MGESKTIQRIKSSLTEMRRPKSTLWIIGGLALAARMALFPYVSEDSTIFFLPWMQELRTNGLAALGGDFANYNFPYLFLLFLASLLPIEPLYAIKVVSVAGDCLLAFSVGALVAQFRQARILPATAALIALFVPTVLLNASMWGQCDAIYASLLLFSLRSLLRNNGRNAWLWWAIALSFKLQAVFILPVLAVVSLRNRHSPLLPALAAVTWVMLSIPPALFGRSFGSIFGVYVHQTQDERMVSGAANIYAWIPSVTAAEGRLPAILLCGAVLLLTAYAYWRGPDSSERRVLFAITVAAICPFLLPQMHDRYFFVVEVMSLLLIRHKKLFFIPWLFAGTGLFVYALYFLSNQYAWPLMLASIIQCFAIGMLLHNLWTKADQQVRSGLSGASR